MPIWLPILLASRRPSISTSLASRLSQFLVGTWKRRWPGAHAEVPTGIRNANDFRHIEEKPSGAMLAP
jgi:hypothetical protein